MREDRITFALIVVLLCASNALSMTRIYKQSALTESPAVISAVAPVYPPIAATVHVSGEITVEVTLNEAGVPKLAKALNGHPLLRKSAQDAAIRWRFVASADNVKARSVRLTFIFSPVLYEAGSAALTPIFYPPYRIEVQHQEQPHIDVNVSPYQRRRNHVPYNSNQKHK